MTIEDMLSREAIRDTLARIARGEDRRDDALIRSGYWPEARIDFGVFAGSFDDYLGWCVPGSPEISVTQHILAQSLIMLDGDTARVETYVISYHRVKAGDEERDTAMGARYLDRFERRDGDWRFVSRTMIYDWDRDLGVAADWSTGLMGMAFTDDHYTGRANGDFSVRFVAAG